MRVPVPALLAMLFLSGCALPPAVAVASLAANGVSFATTGKSTTDHAISAVVGEDCALLRVASEKEICDPNGDVLLALEVTETPDADWYIDPEIGSEPAVAVDTSGSQFALNGVDQTTAPQPSQLSATPAAATSPFVRSETHRSLDNLVALAIDPTPRGNFADARPALKPATPELPQRFAPPPQVQAAPAVDGPKPWISRLTGRTRGIFGKPRQQ